jgi:DNA repair protein RadC
LEIIMKRKDAALRAIGNQFEGLRTSMLTKAEKSTVVELALAVLRERHRSGRSLGNSEQTKAYLQLRLATRKHEVFGALYLDNRHRIIRVVEMFNGTINGASVHPRTVVQQALEVNAAAIVLFHNHPSGVAEPSHADEAITTRLRDALALVDVRVLDHFVIAAGESVSFAERGLI